MASSPSSKLTSFLFILSFLFVQIGARESHFFSKVPNNDNVDTKRTQVIDPLTNPQDQQPNFIPQTQGNGYGLYGHESGQLPPNSDDKFADPTTYNNDAVPYKSASEEYDNDNFQNGNSRKPYENSFYYNKDLYDNHRRQSSFHNTRLSSRDDFTTTTSLYDDNSSGGNADNNVVRQGMSDTRFMENGKYYYDLNREPQYHYYSSGSRGNFGNNNNGNTFEYGNSMGRFQNDEAEFQEEPDMFVP